MLNKACDKNLFEEKKKLPRLTSLLLRGKCFYLYSSNVALGGIPGMNVITAKNAPT